MKERLLKFIENLMYTQSFVVIWCCITLMTIISFVAQHRGMLYLVIPNLFSAVNDNLLLFFLCSVGIGFVITLIIYSLLIALIIILGIIDAIRRKRK